MGKQRIRDPALFQWFFFLRWHTRDSNEHRNEHLRGFRVVLEEAWRWADGEPGSPGLSLPSPASPQVSHRLAALPWREKDGMLRMLEARTLLDAFYIQLGQAKRDEVEPSAFASLTRWTTKTLEGEPSSHHAYLGEGVCLCAEVDEGLSEEDFRRLAWAIIRHGPGYSEKQTAPEGILLPFGFLVPVPDAERETMVFLCPSSAASQASRFVHFTLPQLLLNLIKARAIAEDYNHNLLPQAQRQEQDLGTLLKQAAQPHLPLELLERLSANISRRQAAFIESISALEEQLQTLRVCLRNIELLLDDPLWGEQRQRAQQLLAGNMALLIEQVRSDLHYLRITQQQADLALASLMTVGSVRSTQWERRITLVLFAFTVIGLAQAFPELPWWGRLAIIALSIPLGALGYWWLRKR